MSDAPYAQFGKKFISQTDAETFSPLKAVGGVLGIVAAALPALLFLIFFLIIDLVPALLVAILSLVPITGYALITKQSLSPVFSGFVGVGISAAFAYWSGSGANFYITGLIINLVYALLVLALILLRKDPIGLAVELINPQIPKGWREEEIYSQLKTACLISSYLWLGLYILRTVIQIPLWYLNLVGPLGISKLLMGLPLTALIAWLSWLNVTAALKGL
ncbi:DUF3159 domain-containing protein [Actinomycetaceae bacterium TAE3-ERU4]|nr:DUF3159 domain-containing protein [Actinomycetaceae bacterium TAE3-ERU4]